VLQRAVDDYIKDNQERFVKRLQDLCRKESVSAKGKEGVRDCASLVAEIMRDIGIKTTVIDPSGGNPIIYGEVKSSDSDKTLIFYSHYDVQPAEPLELWKSMPFAAEIRNGVVYARGAEDNKGNLAGKLCATEAFLKTTGDAPMNLKFLFEGEEEIGSPSLPRFIKENKSMLSADVTIGEGGPVSAEGRPIIRLGNKGLLYVELHAETASLDQHSQEAVISPSAAWRLLWAIGSLKDPSERVKIEGFYSDVEGYSQEEERWVTKSPFEEEERRKGRGIDQFLLGLRGNELKLRYFGEPTCNICGFTTGYSGKGSKTVLPAKASAKMDFRLVPNQDPSDILKKLKKHLKQKGFDDIVVESLGQLFPSRTPVTNPYVRAAMKKMKQVYGKEAVIEITSAGSGPRYLFEKILNAPMVNAGGSGNIASKVHGPNENVRVSDYARGIRANAVLIEGFSQVGVKK
jgi:acetylornithine deacetylase/succinyl-diaminopimelate desuccinylase-like protein